MKAVIFYPTSLVKRSGNFVTAARWKTILEDLGHEVQLRDSSDVVQCDIAVCLHAIKTAQVIRQLKAEDCQRKVIVALTGTDINSGITDSLEGMRSLELADRLVVLQPLAVELVPEKFRSKVFLIYQSAEPAETAAKHEMGTFKVLVSGHLRKEKDSLRAAYAARKLPENSRIMVLHLGGAMEEALSEIAVAEMKTNYRYRWLGEVSHQESLEQIRSCDVLVSSSFQEGAPSVISEAIVSGTAVLASKIQAHQGLLGDDYPGFFTAGDTDQLFNLLLRVENDEGFYQKLKRHILSLQPLFTPAVERASWQRILDELQRCS